MNFFMPSVAFNLRSSYLDSVWTVVVLCVHEHFHVNLESPLSCFGWGVSLEGGGLVVVVVWGFVSVLVFWRFFA